MEHEKARYINRMTGYNLVEDSSRMNKVESVYQKEENLRCILYQISLKILQLTGI